ncbi:MAG: ABC transporter substrate-binding protein, partial [Chloroflexota bacterium]
MSMRKSGARKSPLTLLLAFLIIAIILAPMGDKASASSVSSGTLIGGFDVGPGGSPEVFNPLIDTAGFTWLQKYYSSLVLYDVNFTKIQGDLATSWKVSKDGTQYTFHLHPGVLWS